MNWGLGNFLGLILVSIGIAWYSIKLLQPGLAKTYDLYLSAIATLAGVFLIFQGGNLLPITLWVTFLLIGMGTVYLVESLHLRK